MASRPHPRDPHTPAGVRLGLAGPDAIRSWSSGEVVAALTLDPHTLRPQDGGIFCEHVFGPLDHETCRSRMGHVELAAPVVHPLFLQAPGRPLATLLGLPPSTLAGIASYRTRVVTERGSTPLSPGQLLSERRYRRHRRQYGDAFEAATGGEAVLYLLRRLDLAGCAERLRRALDGFRRAGSWFRLTPAQLKELARLTGSSPRISHTLQRLARLLARLGRRKKPAPPPLRDRLAGLWSTRARSVEGCLRRRLRLVGQMRRGGGDPAGLVLRVLPVVPAGLRPPRSRAGALGLGRLNVRYLGVLRSSLRVRDLCNAGAPEREALDAGRRLQRSVSALFACLARRLPGGGRRGRQGAGPTWPGKRVDYSARGALVADPRLRLHQCGLPAERIALVLYRPFLLHRLRELGHTSEDAAEMVRERSPAIWGVLAEVVRGRPVLLGPGPAPRRDCLQAFEPVLVWGSAIHVHPLAFAHLRGGAGEAVVHLPLSEEARDEAATLMSVADNLGRPVGGQCAFPLAGEAVLGCYYLTLGLEEAGRADEEKAFTGPPEVELAHSLGRLHPHARIRLRLPLDRRVLTRGDRDHLEEIRRGFPGPVRTTAGRALFNDILPPKMAFYDLPMTARHLARVLADCHQLLGPDEAIRLLERIHVLGSRELARSGLSLALNDLNLCPGKELVLAEGEKQAGRNRRMYDRGLITEMERFHHTLDVWTDARDRIGREVQARLAGDPRGGDGTLTPVPLMAASGAIGVERVRRLAGMVGVVARSNGSLLEEPVRTSFREGHGVLAYLFLLWGARHEQLLATRMGGLAGDLTRRLAAAAHDMTVTAHDCGTRDGVVQSVLYRGEAVERPLSAAIQGRVSCKRIENPLTGEALAGEGEVITLQAARSLENMGVERVRVRSPLTCAAAQGVCQLCHGADAATGRLIEVGTAAGVAAALALGGRAAELVGRVIRISHGPGRPTTEPSDARGRRPGTVRLAGLVPVLNDRGERITLTPGEVRVVDYRGRVLEAHPVPRGALLQVEEGQQVGPHAVLASWDPHSTPVLAGAEGWIRFVDFVGLSNSQTSTGGGQAPGIPEPQGDANPRILLEDAGRVLECHYLTPGAVLAVRDGQHVAPGTCLARIPRRYESFEDLVEEGLPRLAELLEARRPRRAAVLAEAEGRVRRGARSRHGRTVHVHPEGDPGLRVGGAVEHWVPAGSHLRVHDGDRVGYGDRLTWGRRTAHDLLRILGSEEAQHHLVREIGSIYRTHRIDIDDRHIELIVARMLRGVEVVRAGDTTLVPGTVVDRAALAEANAHLLRGWVKVAARGSSDLEEGNVVPREVFEQTRARLQAENTTPPTGRPPEPALSRPCLLGVSAAARHAGRPLCAGGLVPTLPALLEAALAGTVDPLDAPHDNVVAGRLIPAGTGYPRPR